MRPVSVLFLAAIASVGASGCVAKTAFDVATAPVRVAGAAVDAVTTSQSEADEKRGRELRKREEELGKLERRYDDQLNDCSDGDQKACAKAQQTYDEMRKLMRGLPAAPEN